MTYKSGKLSKTHHAVILVNPYTNNLICKYGKEGNFLLDTIYRARGTNKKVLGREVNREGQRLARCFGVRYKPIVRGVR